MDGNSTAACSVLLVHAGAFNWMLDSVDKHMEGHALLGTRGIGGRRVQGAQGHSHGTEETERHAQQGPEGRGGHAQQGREGREGHALQETEGADRTAQQGREVAAGRSDGFEADEPAGSVALQPMQYVRAWNAVVRAGIRECSGRSCPSARAAGLSFAGGCTDLDTALAMHCTALYEPCTSHAPQLFRPSIVFTQ